MLNDCQPYNRTFKHEAIMRFHSSADNHDRKLFCCYSRYLSWYIIILCVCLGLLIKASISSLKTKASSMIRPSMVTLWPSSRRSNCSGRPWAMLIRAIALKVGSGADRKDKRTSLAHVEWIFFLRGSFPLISIPCPSIRRIPWSAILCVHLDLLFSMSVV